MTHRLTTALASASLLATIASPSAQATGEARVLDRQGHVLTVGNWETHDLDSGPLRVETDHALSFEYRGSDGRLLSEGYVPGTNDSFADGTPVLSLDPVSGRLFAAWSRESASGSRQIVLQVFTGDSFAPVPTVLATGLANQTDPDLIHDRSGNAYVTWRDMDWAQRIELLALDPDGAELLRTRISTEATVKNGAPRLGVDATGSLFVAYLGLQSGGGQPLLRVHAATDIGGGVIHVPSPIIELGRLSELDVTGSIPTPDPNDFKAPPLEVTILGGTPVLWWLTKDALGRPVLKHAIRTGEGSWTEEPLGTIALTTLGDAEVAVRSALEMIEARYRSVVSLVGPEPPPLLPRPSLGLSADPSVHRR